MKIKLVFGVIVPLVIIVLLAIFGSLDIGFSMKREFIESVSVSSIFSENTMNRVKIGEVILENDYLFARRVDLPEMKACLVDSETEGVIDAGEVFYSEGDYPKGYDLGYDSYSGIRNVQVGAYSSKKVAIYAYPSYVIYPGYGEFNSSKYSNYDKVVVVEVEEKYTPCSSIHIDFLDKGANIQLLS